jgi:hypothetical protein
MGRKYPEFINGFRDRHGKMRFYFRRGSISLAVPSPGTSEFSEEYASCWRNVNLIAPAASPRRARAR